MKYNEEIGSDQGTGVDQIIAECGCDDSSWKSNELPNTITLRRMILLADWASREPKRWMAYRMFYLDGIHSSTKIAERLHVADRTVRRWLEPVFLKNRLK